MPRIIHAPDPRWSGSYCQREGKLLIAESDDTITCTACLRLLHDHAQYANQLRAEGYKFANRDRPKRGRKVSKKQTGFHWE